MSHTGRILKALIAPLFWRVEFTTEPDPWGGKRFRMHPRYVPIYIWRIATIPFSFFLCGILGVVDSFRQKLTVKGWSSYRIPKDEKPTKWKAYLLF